MNKLGRTILIALIGLVVLAVAAIVFWPWLRTILPHPALVEAWLGYLVNDLQIGVWGPIVLLLLLGLIELVWAVNLGRRSGAQERQVRRLERLQEKEVALLEQEMAQLQEERRSLLADLDRLGHLVREEEERLWAEFEELERASDLDFSHLTTVETVEIPAELRGEWRRLISQLERIELSASLRVREEPSAMEKQRRFVNVMRLGGACYHLGQYERALSHYRQALDLAPSDPDAILSCAVVNYALGRLSAALDGLDRSLKLGDTAWGYLYRGLVCERQGENRQALEDYGRAIALEADFPEAYHRRGLLYAKLGDLDQAVQDQTRVLELDGGHAGAFTARGAVRAESGKAELALDDLDQACALAPQEPKIFYHRGRVHRELKNYDQALEDLTHAIELFPAFAPAFLARGNTHQILQQYQQAVADYGEAIHLQPQNAEAFWSRGQAQAALTEYKAAIEDFDAALEIDGSLAGALADRGAAYEQLGEHEQALQDLDQAIALDPALASAYYERGLVHGNQGEYDLASRDLDRAVELDPSLRSVQLGDWDEGQE